METKKENESKGRKLKKRFTKVMSEFLAVPGEKGSTQSGLESRWRVASGGTLIS